MSKNLPDDGPIQSRFGEFLVVIGMVQVLRVALSGDLESVWGAGAEGGVAARHELGPSAVGLPTDQTILVLVVVLVRQVDVGVLLVGWLVG